MRRLRTTASRWAALACLLIALIFALRAVDAPTIVYTVLEAVMAVLAGLTGLMMWLHNSFETHLAASIVVVATVGSTLLAVTAGVPGLGPVGLTSLRTTELLLCVTVVGLMILDGRMRSEHDRRIRPSYAR